MKWVREISNLKVNYGLALSFLIFSSAAWADCSNPSGVAGHQMYNSTYNVMQYCNGTRWIAMSAETSGVWIQAGANIYYETGRVGIGLNNPSVELDVSGSVTVSNNFKVSSLISGLIVADETGLFRKETVVPALNFPALTGAITTTSGSYETVLSDNAVTTTKINDNAVTSAKMADNAVALGTDTTGNYAASVTAGAGITVTGTAAEGWSPTITNSGDTTSDTIGDNGTITLSTTGSEVTGILPVANGGTNNSTAYTAGSVIFSNGTALTQNNAGLFWNNANSRLGIGTASPSYRLHVDGGSSAAIYGTSTTNYGVNGNSSSGAGVYGFSNTGYGGSFFGNSTGLYTTASSPSGYALITGTGNVGIGIAAPTSKLHVDGGAGTAIYGIAVNGRGVDAHSTNGIGVFGQSSVAQGVFGQSDSSHGGYFTSNTGTGLYATSTSGYALVTGTGNVGIGTSTPTAKLEVAGDIRGNHAFVSHNLVTSMGAINISSASYVDIPSSSKTITIPAGMAMLFWNISGYTNVTNSGFAVRVCIDTTCGGDINIFMNIASSHDMFSGSWITPVTQGSKVVKLQLLRRYNTGSFITDSSDNISWGLIVFRGDGS